MKYGSIDEAAKAVISNHSDRAQMREVFLQIVRQDAALLRELVDERLDEIAADFISEKLRDMRREIVNAHISRIETARPDQQVAAAQRLSNSSVALLDFILASGIRLRDANARDLRLAARQYIKPGRTEIARGIWCKTIAAKLPRNVTVGAHFKDRELRHMYATALTTTRGAVEKLERIHA